MSAFVDAAAVAARLGSAEEFTTWVEELDRIGPPAAEVALPEPDQLDELFERLGVHADDAEDLKATRPSPSEDPELWWLLQRCHQTLLRDLGNLDAQWLRWPHLPADFGAKGRFFYPHVFLASIPAVLRYHEKRGISEDVSWATLADLGRQIAIYRRINGVGGLDVQFWFSLHFRGLIYDMGRLQFNRGKIHYDEQMIEATGAPFRPGDTALGVHIPESGPMTQEACEESFRRAKDFYDRYFPEENYRYALCTSWLLDPQLADYLPEDSNIIRFQRRFQVVPGGHDGDKDVFQFVFRMINPSIDQLPRRSTLERAVVSHLEAGKHWKVRSGWVAL
ncbi:acyltransferase domain-containing protein [Actinopolymorpha alba]|uniref:acyltransferase domain-containing protein n=1 Tax=Actinopolymorpha alba TaxID=533267 RepID=UPI000376819B|nr:acyltransferase domain-containing protein [Actinopolymorpha alba]